MEPGVGVPLPFRKMDPVSSVPLLILVFVIVDAGGIFGIVSLWTGIAIPIKTCKT